MISTILFVVAAFFGIIFLVWSTQGYAMLRSGKYAKVTLPMWPLLVALILVIIGVIL